MTEGISKIPCCIMRGGTSKAVFVKDSDVEEFLTSDNTRDKLILKLFGSPDPRQIDGLGGADILTSKFALIGVSSSEEADIDYTFAQVGIEKAEVSYSINCGNISPAVGVFAIEEGLVQPVEPITKVRIHNTNTGKILIANVPVKNGIPQVYGDFQIDGVPGTGAKIDMDYALTFGSKTGKLLPTDSVIDELYIPELGRNINVSIVDMANLCVMFDLSEIGLDGTEGLDDFNKDIMLKFRYIKKATQLKLGIKLNELVPFPIGVQKSKDYKTLTGSKVNRNEIDLLARLVGSSSLKLHKTFPGTGATCLAVASAIPGTVPYEMSNGKVRSQEKIRIGHPSGVMNVEVKIKDSENLIVEHVMFPRTARRIMDGNAYIKW